MNFDNLTLEEKKKINRIKVLIETGCKNKKEREELKYLCDCYFKNVPKIKISININGK